MRFEHCILCQELHPRSQIKLKICKVCYDKIEDGIQPTLDNYLALDLSQFFDWEPLPHILKNQQPHKHPSIKDRVRNHAISRNTFGNFK